MVFQNYYFEIAAILIHIIILFAIFYRKTYRGKTNGIFVFLNILALSVAVFDVINGAIKTAKKTTQEHMAQMMQAAGGGAAGGLGSLFGK